MYPIEYKNRRRVNENRLTYKNMKKAFFAEFSAIIIEVSVKNLKKNNNYRNI
jgi:hypothetical protein